MISLKNQNNLSAMSFTVLAPELVHLILDQLTFDNVVSIITTKPSYFNKCVQSHAHYGRVFGNLHDSDRDLGRVRDAILLFYELSPWIDRFSGPELLEDLKYVPFYARDKMGSARALCIFASPRVDAPGLNGFVSRKHREIETLIQYHYCYECDDQSLESFVVLLRQPAYELAFREAITLFGLKKRKEVIRRMRKEADLHRHNDFDTCRRRVFERALDSAFIESLTDETRNVVTQILGDLKTIFTHPPQSATWKIPKNMSKTFHLLARLYASAAMIEAAEQVFKTELERRIEPILSRIPARSFVSFNHYFTASPLNPPHRETPFDATARHNAPFWDARLQHAFAKTKHAQLTRLAALLSAHPTLLARCTDPARPALRPNAAHIAARLRIDASRASHYHFARRELPLVPLDADLTAVCDFLAAYPLERSVVKLLSPAAACAMEAFAPPRAGAVEHAYPDATTRDVLVVLEGLEYLYDCMEMQKLRLRRVRAVKAGVLGGGGARMIEVIPYSVCSEGAEKTTQWVDRVGNGRAKDAVSARDWRAPFDQRELDWLAAFLRVCVYVKAINKDEDIAGSRQVPSGVAYKMPADGARA